MTKKTEIELWSTTSWAGNEEAQLDRILESSYEARFLWLCQAYDFLKDTLPNKFTTKSE